MTLSFGPCVHFQDYGELERNPCNVLPNPDTLTQLLYQVKIAPLLVPASFHFESTSIGYCKKAIKQLREHKCAPDA